MHENLKIPLKRYIVIFIASYIGLSLALAIAAYFIDGPNGVKFILPMLSGMMARDSFLTRQNRIPTRSETNTLILYAFLGIAVFEIIMAVILIWTGALGDITLSLQTLILIGLTAIAIMLIINYFILLWVFGGNAKKRLKIMQKKKGNIGDVFD